MGHGDCAHLSALSKNVCDAQRNFLQAQALEFRSSAVFNQERHGLHSRQSPWLIGIVAQHSGAQQCVGCWLEKKIDPECWNKRRLMAALLLYDGGSASLWGTGGTRALPRCWCVPAANGRYGCYNAVSTPFLRVRMAV